MANPSLYATMTALEAINARQTAQSNNLVNANTPGFRARQTAQSNNLVNANTPGFRAQLSTLVAAPIHGPSADTGHADVIAGANGYSRKAGPLKETGSAWNVAITGNGWLTTRDAQGRILLTRDGRLHTGPNGLLEDSRGHEVLNTRLQPISLPPLQNLRIGEDGTISGVTMNGRTRLAQQFGRLYVAATPATGLRRMGGARFGGIANPADLTPATGAHVKQGYLEGSDVQAVKVMTNLIAGVRNFQVATRMQTLSNTSQTSLNSLVSQG